MSWPSWIDRRINQLKWPCAALAAAAIPMLAWALVQLLLRVISRPLAILPFLAGIVLFVLLWRRWLGDSRVGRFAITLEHEATHALFAWLTGHKIIGFRATVGRGGEVRFAGEGNWLIVIAPYFFPTAALLLFVIAYLLPFPGLPWQSLLLGAALGYHVMSTIRETHKDQTDIQKLGKLFCWMFLPAANLAVVGLLISFAHGGSGGLSQWFSDCTQSMADFTNWLLHSVMGRSAGES